MWRFWAGGASRYSSSCVGTKTQLDESREVNSGVTYSWSEHPSSVVLPCTNFLLGFCYFSFRQRLPRNVAGVSGGATDHGSTAKKICTVFVKKYVKFKNLGKVEMLGWKLEENSGKICIAGNWRHDHVWGHLKRENRKREGIQAWNTIVEKSLRCPILHHFSNGSVE